MTTIKIYNYMVSKVRFFFKQLKLTIIKSTGRPLAINPEDTIALSLFKQSQNIKTKKSVWQIFNLKCSYKTLVVNMNRLSVHALLILQAILKWNQRHSHPIKHTDSTDVPVCLVKNGRRHQTMNGLADWGYSSKGWFYGLKMNITADLKRKLLAVRFSSGNVDDRRIFRELNKNMMGLFVADAGYISQELERDFFIENKRMLLAKPRANMKRLATKLQNRLYDTRMQIELNFRNLKQFYELETSLPKSIDGYLGNYIYSLLAYVLR